MKPAITPSQLSAASADLTSLANGGAKRRRLSWPGQFYRLLLSEILVLRIHWFWHLIQMSLMPLLFMAFLTILMGTNAQSVLYVITGSVAQALTTSSMVSLGQDLGYMKETQAYERYATLPISKSAFILAVSTRGVILAFPSVLITLTVASAVFSIRLSFSPVTLGVMALAGYSLAGLGALIGFYSPSSRVAGLATQFILPLLVYFAPVYIPLERLPRILAWIAAVMPTTYVARVLRASLQGSLSPQEWQDLVILLAITVLSLILVSRKVDWRAGDK